MRSLFPACEVTVTARHAFQADAARAAGAHRVVLSQDRYAHFEELATATGAKVSGHGRGQMLLGGFPYVIEAVGGLESVTESIRLVDNWGTVMFIGAGGMGEVDLSALWFKEAELVGAWNHSHGDHPTRGNHHSIDLALEVLAAGGLPESVVTHSFPLEDVRGGRCATAIDKRNSHAIKVVLRRGCARRADEVGFRWLFAVAVAERERARSTSSARVTCSRTRRLSSSTPTQTSCRMQCPSQ